MNRFLSVLLAVLLLSGPAFSQAVQQSGTVTPGHVPSWVTSGIIKDGGSATSSNITEMGVTKNGGLPFCVNSANTGALNRVCLTSTTSSGAKLTITDQGGATDGTLTIDINGNSVVLPAVPGGTVLPTVLTTPAIADSAPTCFSGTDGTLKSCGGTPGTGTVTSVAAGTGISASPSPITTSGTISLAPIASGNLLGNSSGGSAAPTVQTVGSGLSLAMDTLEIGTASVTNAMLANMANGTVKCRSTAGTGAPEDCTITQIFSLLGSPAQGDIIYFNGSLEPTLLPAGTSGQVLQTQGAGANPQWVDVGPFISLSTMAASTSASLTFNTAAWFTDYDVLVFEFVDLVPATDGTKFQMQMNGASGASDYKYSMIKGYSNVASVNGVNSDAATSILLAPATASEGIGNAANEGYSGSLKLFNPSNAAQFKRVNGQSVYTNELGYLEQVTTQGSYQSATAVTSVTFSMTSGNITSGRINLYGMRRPS